jgi:hypothetical protein
MIRGKCSSRTYNLRVAIGQDGQNTIARGLLPMGNGGQLPGGGGGMVNLPTPPSTVPKIKKSISES